MKKPSYATLQRKIRRLQADVNRVKKRNAVGIRFIDHLMVSKYRLRGEITRLSSLLQAYKDRETDKAHRIIRNNP